ncbi:dolichyl-phosphate-mannose-protein mannosyltransferase [Rudaeicoccus suwonensis]|uniref:Dolichyl-phosphate-mannose-protein mannosyltransferase n=2 Tax=Rudaeicoccus suwonensis TaxID=657409 RepID=A0A561E7H5_9MICO|nr:dolichyl-phosphate-mannose-protein mannosyltransferase [Rudaeicoccus suwonensis]
MPEQGGQRAVTEPRGSRRLRWESHIGAFLQRIAGGYLALVGLGVLITPVRSPSGYSAVAAAAIAVLTVAVWCWWFVARRRRTDRSPRVTGRYGLAFGVVLAAVLSAFSAVIAISQTYVVTWDAGVIRDGAAVHRLPAYLAKYFEMYSNNIPMLYIARHVRSAGAHVGLGYSGSFVVLNTACLFVTLVAVHLLVRRLTGDGPGMVAQVLTVVFVGISPWMVVGYTDVLCMPCVMVGLVLAAYAAHARRLRTQTACYFGCCIVIGVGMLLKPTAVIVLIAAAAALLATVVRRHRGRRLVIGLLVIVVGAGLCAGTEMSGSKFAIDRVGLSGQAINSSPATPLSFIAGGLLEVHSKHGTTYGGFNYSLIRHENGKTPEQVDRMSRHIIREQLEQRGVLGTVGYEWSKSRWNWGDSTFWAYHEGSDITARVIAHGPLVATVRAWNHPGGRYYHLHNSVGNGIWFGLIMISGFGLLIMTYRRDVALVALTVLGIALFTLIFQGRSRYLLPFVPAVIVLVCALPGTRVAPYARRIAARVPWNSSAGQAPTA